MRPSGSLPQETWPLRVETLLKTIVRSGKMSPDGTVGIGHVAVEGLLS